MPDEWEGPIFRHFGKKAGPIIEVAEKQDLPETCWAAAMRMAFGLVGVAAPPSQTILFHRVKTAGLLDSGGTRVQPYALKTFLDCTSWVRFAGWYAIADSAGAMMQALGGGGVILLMNNGHVVLLAQIQVDKNDASQVTFHVVDPADGRLAGWTPIQIALFMPDGWGVIYPR